MTPSEIVAIRRRTGLTQAQFAKALRLGPQGGRTVRRWEAGKTRLPGPASIVYELVRDGILEVEAHDDELIRGGVVTVGVRAS